MKYDGTNLEEVLEAHRRFLRTGHEEDRANFDGADLRSVDLDNLDLRCASFVGANFANQILHGLRLNDACCIGACFTRVILIDVDLSQANLQRANFSNADLRMGIFRGADCTMATFKDAEMRGSIFWYSNLYLADFTGAYNTGVEFYKADLLSAVNAPHVCTFCPETGAFVAWKSCMSANGVEIVIVKLLIPEDAKRSSGTDYKCRASKAEVLEIQAIDGRVLPDKKAFSRFDSSFVYCVGQTVYPSNFCEDRFMDCAGGIHFFMNRQDAVNY